MKPTPEMIEAGARALMIEDGCGLTIEGERVFCDHPKAKEPNSDCICKRGAAVAVTAALEQVAPAIASPPTIQQDELLERLRAHLKGHELVGSENCRQAKSWRDAIGEIERLRAPKR